VRRPPVGGPASATRPRFCCAGVAFWKARHDSKTGQIPHVFRTDLRLTANDGSFCQQATSNVELPRNLAFDVCPAIRAATVMLSQFTSSTPRHSMRRRSRTLATATAARHPHPYRAGNRRWSLRIICAAAIGVEVAAAAAIGCGLADVPTKADGADKARPTPSAMGSIAARSPTSVIAFPASNGTTEGRLSLACSLTSILPGANATLKVLDEPFLIGADLCVAHVGDEAATMGPGNATRRDLDALTSALATMIDERGSRDNRWPAPVATYEPHAAQGGAQPHCPAGSRLVDGQPWWPEHPSLIPVAKGDAVDGGRQLVEDER